MGFLKKLLLAGVFFIGGAFYGMFVFQFKVFPFELLHSLYFNAKTFSYSEDTSKYDRENIQKLIQVNTNEDILRKRKNLVDFLWGGEDLSFTNSELTIENNYADQKYIDIHSLKTIDKINYFMEQGIDSQIYHFHPVEFNGKVILYHQGHRGDFYHSKKQIEFFLNRGYSVVAFSMPLRGMNSQPKVYNSRTGHIKLTSHEQMKFIELEKGHPVKFFIEPVIGVLDYLEENYQYNSVNMVGISGGGWTTVVAAAIDERIQSSFPVAGSLPIFLRSESVRDWGDWEQTVPELYYEANYLELYIMGAFGKHRKQIQIFNNYDPCCFNGYKSKVYSEVVEKKIFELNQGFFATVIDVSHKRHEISDYALTRIINEIENK